MRRAKILAWIAALLALALPAVMAYLGSHSRLLSDDYCIFAKSRESGAWDTLLYFWNSWTSSYTRFFLMDLAAPFDTAVASITPIAIVIFWCAVTLWVFRLLASRLQPGDSSMPLLFTLAFTLVGASINSFHSGQSFYWLVASIAYTLPIPIFLVCVGIALKAAEWPVRSARFVSATVAVGLIGFINAGLSEIFLMNQFVLLAGLFFGAVMFMTKPVRRPYTILLGMCVVSTVVSLVLQLNSPGIARRMHSQVYAELGLGSSVRALPELLQKSLEITYEQIGHQPAFTSYVLILSLTIRVTLSLYRPEHHQSAVRARTLATGPLGIGLAVQILFLPVMWTHSSDSTQFLGRFSAGFFLVVCLNLAQSLVFALLLVFKRRVNELFRDLESLWPVYISAIQLAVLLLFAMGQARSIHYTAATYLFSSSFALLCLLLWQLADRFPDTDSRRWRLLPLFASGLALLSYLAMVALSLVTLGFLSERILAGASFLHVASGVAWGLSLGILMRRSGIVTRPDGEASRLYRSGAALVVVVLAAGIVIGQSQRLPELAAFATEWDARHQEIIRQRDSGSAAIVVPELSYNLGDIVYRLHIFDDNHNKCPKLYYGVESITRSGAG